MNDLGAEWTLRSYIVDGRFCPPNALTGWLDAWRERHHRAWAVLIPFTTGTHPTSESVVFGSLLLVSHQDQVIAKRTQSAIMTVLNARTTAELERSLQAIHTLWTGKSPMSRRLPQELGTKLRNSTVVRTALKAITPNRRENISIWRPPLNHDGDKQIHIVVLTGQADNKPIRVGSSSELEDLAIMLHTTHQVVVHWHERRPRMAGEIVRRRRASRIESVDSPSQHLFRGTDILANGTEQEYADLFCVVREAGLIGEHGAAALYLRDRDGSSLRLTAQLTAPAAPTRIDLEGGYNIALAVQRRRPRVVNRVLTESTYHPGNMSSWFGGTPKPSDFSEVIVPIAGGVGDDPGSVAGALIVQRETECDADVFAARDIDDLELLGLHFALRRGNLLFAEVTDRLAELTGRSILLSVSPLEDPDPSSDWWGVPSDFCQARSTLCAALSLAYKHVNANRAALYLMAWDQQSLVRVAGEGDGPDETAGTISLSKSGVGLARQAFIDGRIITIEDGRLRGAVGKSAEEWRTKSIRSALAVPVTLFDRVVGVLVLTSQQRAAFAETLRFVQALAQHMGLVLMLSQRSEEQRGFVISSSTAVHAHEILKRVDGLRRSIDPRARELAIEIQNFVDSGQRPNASNIIPSASPYEILDQVAADVGVSEWVVWDRARESVPPLSPAVALALRRAAHEVLKNSKSHLNFDGSATRVTLRSRVHQRGGMPRLLIDITQSSDEPVPEQIVNKIYRTPIEGSLDSEPLDRRHFGAFIAGYWMRAVGGDIYLRDNQPGNGRVYVGTTLEVPIYTLAPMSPKRPRQLRTVGPGQ